MICFSGNRFLILSKAGTKSQSPNENEVIASGLVRIIEHVNSNVHVSPPFFGNLKSTISGEGIPIKLQAICLVSNLPGIASTGS